MILNMSFRGPGLPEESAFSFAWYPKQIPRCARRRQARNDMRTRLFEWLPETAESAP